ncbi:unnamed protein product [Peniophora sp. CBMAI 1063]|nr:unnamed protein product [Peniophora sp. CBMAI 1063]
MTQTTSAFIAHLRALPLPTLIIVIISFSLVILVPLYLLGRSIATRIAHRRLRRTRHTYIFNANPAQSEPNGKLSRAGSLAVSLRHYASTKSSHLSSRLSTRTSTNARIPAHWPRGSESPLASPFLPATGDLGGLITPFTLTYDDSDAVYGGFGAGGSEKMCVRREREEAYTAFPEPRRGDWVVVQLPELAAVPTRTRSKRSTLRAVTPISPLPMYSPLAPAYPAYGDGKRDAMIVPPPPRSREAKQPRGILKTSHSGGAYPSPPPTPVDPTF